MSSALSGTLYGIGVGPGDPELLTLKAIQTIRDCPVVAYPTLEGAPSFARAIIAAYLNSAKTEIPIPIPMGDNTATQKAYDIAAVSIARHLNMGHNVALLCEGDPFFYGSFMYIYGRLYDRQRIDIIPGVSSPMAAAAALAMPLAARNDVFTVLPAPLDNSILEKHLTHTDSAAIIKIGRHFSRIRDLLRELELHDRARYIERATLPSQKLLTLDKIVQETVPYFSMILVHRRRIAWQDT
ncbi:MAG: precorrin-2 C(20)-methyltransferase [Alphaproteobacteria bacterium]